MFKKNKAKTTGCLYEALHEINSALDEAQNEYSRLTPIKKALEEAISMQIDGLISDNSAESICADLLTNKKEAK